MRYAEISEYARLLGVPEGKKIEVQAVESACRAAYKAGLIAAAQAICAICPQKRPVRRDGVFQHDIVGACPAWEILELLDAAGGWQAAWPIHEPGKVR